MIFEIAYQRRIPMSPTNDPDAPTPHLADSALYSENVFAHGHTSVWGSWWQQNANGSSCWGYACCKGLVKSELCSLSQAACGKTDTDGGAGAQFQLARGNESDDEIPIKLTAELQRRSEYDGPTSAFSRQVITWLLKQWDISLCAFAPPASTGFAQHPIFSSRPELHKAEVGLQPLLDLLQRAERRLSRMKRLGISTVKVLTERDDWDCPHCHYRNHGDRITCRKCKRDDADYVEPDEFPKFEELILEKVGRVLELIADQDYRAATEAFLALTIGTTRWSSDISGLMAGHAPTRKARAAQGHMLRQAAELAPKDSEEGKIYLNCLKRLITLAQLLRPNSDVTKNVSM